jgi:hypothetical protein
MNPHFKPQHAKCVEDFAKYKATMHAGVADANDDGERPLAVHSCTDTNKSEAETVVWRK